MKKPAFQFYVGDWKANQKLRRCSWAARGAWIELMGLMHDSEEYGILRWTLEEIIHAVGCPAELVHELVKKGVLKGVDKDTLYVTHKESFVQKNKEPIEETIIENQSGPFWFSSRMVRDEHIRNKRGIHGSKSENNPNVPRKKTENEEDKDIDKDTFSPSPSSSSSCSLKKKEGANEKNDDGDADVTQCDASKKVNAGEICAEFKKMGMMVTNPQNMILIDLINRGITKVELMHGMAEAIERKMPFQYGLKVAADVFANPEKIISKKSNGNGHEFKPPNNSKQQKRDEYRQTMNNLMSKVKNNGSAYHGTQSTEPRDITGECEVVTD